MTTPPLKVLVIEDDLHTQKILEQLLTREPSLRHLQLQVLLAADGEEGLALLADQTVDLVITDLLMPKVDGFKVVDTIRGKSQSFDLPIIVTSAVFRDKVTLKRLEDQRVVVQPKPFSPRDMARRVLAALAPKLRLPDKAASEKPGVPVGKISAGAKGKADAGKPVRPPSPALVRDVLGTDPFAADEPAERGAVAPAKVPPRPAAAPGRAPGAAPAPAAAASRLQRTGGLAERGVPLLLLELYEAQLSGTLDLRRGQVHKLVHVMSGHPIFVQSNQRSETLGQMLVRRGLLTAEQSDRALAASKQEGIKYGEALVRLGFMTEAKVMEELLAQTRQKVEACLTWRNGTYVFTDDPQIGTKVPRCVIDPVALVFEEMRRSPDVEEAFARLADKGNRLVEPLPRLELYRERIAAIWGDELLGTLKPGRSVAQLIQSAQKLQDVVLQLEALLDLELVKLVRQPQAPAAPPLEPPADHLLLDRLVAAPAPEPALSAAPPDDWEENSAVVWAQIDAPRRPVEPAAKAPPRPPVDPERVKVALQLIQATYLGLHDATHYQVLGVMPQSTVLNVEVAYQIKRKQFDLSNFRDMDLGEHYDHLEEICAALDEAFAVVSDPKRRAAYDATRGATAAPRRETRDAALQAESLCREGEERFQAEQYAEASELFARAVSLDEQAEYRALHALSLFFARGETPQAGAEAMVEVQTALANDPGEVTAYLVAAKIARGLGQPAEARQHLQRLIKLDPTCSEGFAELEALLLEEGELEALELEYRRIIHLAGTQDPTWTATLWSRLTAHYRDRLHDPQRARVACEAALRFDPENRELQQLLAALNCDQPERWPEAVLGYRSLLRGDPGQSEPLHLLFRLHHEAARLDAAYVAAAVATSRGLADEPERRFYEERHPAFLKRAIRPLDQASWERLQHGDDFPHLATLFQLLAPVMRKQHPLRLADLDVREADLLAETALPEAFGAVLRYVCTEVGVEPPRVARRPNLGLDIQAAGTDPPLVLAGSLALELTNRVELAFRLGCAASLLRPGRVMAAWRPRRVLRSYILAALQSTFAQLEVPDSDGEVARICAELQGLADLQQAVREIVSGGQQFVRFNLGDWQRGMQRTGERAGLLLCSDVEVACRVLGAQDEDAPRDLVDFALSEAYGELRLSLGLAVE